jgi:hypothetical protein
MVAFRALEHELEIANLGRFSGLFLGMAHAAFIIHDNLFFAVHFSHHAPFWLYELVNAKNLVLYGGIPMMYQHHS